MEITGKQVFGMVVIVACTIILLMSFANGINGTVFAVTMAVIGLTAGSILGFEYGLIKK